MQPQPCTAFSARHAAAAMHYRLSCLMLEPGLCRFLHAPPSQLHSILSHACPPQQPCSTPHHVAQASQLSYSPQPLTSDTHFSLSPQPCSCCSKALELQQCYSSVSLTWQVHRIQNKRLWKNYTHNFDGMKDRWPDLVESDLVNGGASTLWHGTSRTAPVKIYATELGESPPRHTCAVMPT